jgi:hypothetical protein
MHADVDAYINGKNGYVPTLFNPVSPTCTLCRGYGPGSFGKVPIGPPQGKEVMRPGHRQLVMNLRPALPPENEVLACSSVTLSQ